MPAIIWNSISTSAYRRGQAHILDLTFTYVGLIFK